MKLLVLFINNIFMRLEECQTEKKSDFFHGMLLHSSVAVETYFGQLGSYLEIHNN